MASQHSTFPSWTFAPARSVRATTQERARALPGDELIPNAVASLTHAVTIRVPPSRVWPWLAQMGAGRRAGWYSYDWLDNGRRPSARFLIPEFQQPTVGSVFPALPGTTDGFDVVAVAPDRSLVLGWRLPDGVRMMTWAFVLEPLHPGSTRLITRVRGGHNYRFHGLPWWAARPVVTLLHAVMERRQLLGIAERAES